MQMLGNPAPLLYIFAYLLFPTPSLPPTPYDCLFGSHTSPRNPVMHLKAKESSIRRGKLKFTRKLDTCLVENKTTQ